MIGSRVGTLMRIAVLSAIAVAAITGTASASPGHAGRWLTDDDGRVVVVHGMNLSTKGYGGKLAAPGPNLGDAHLSLMEDYGINAVRLTFERYQFAPKPGEFDYGYVAAFADAIRRLQRRGIRTLVDFHQDNYGPVFRGNGFPEWMTITDGLPNLNQLPFPTQYWPNPAHTRAWDHFWANDPDPAGHGRLIDDDIAILTSAVRALRDEPGVMGFEIINEPFAGMDEVQCSDPVSGCAEFETKKLSPYYERVVAALRNVDRRHLIFYEPQVGFDFGSPTHVVPPKDAKLGFSFHQYCLHGTALGIAGATPGEVNSASCDAVDRHIQSNALAHATESGSALLNTEWGEVHDKAMLTNLANLFDENMIPWMYWTYNNVVQGGGDGLTSPTPDPDPDVAAALVRPYPQLIAGTPESWSFNPETKKFATRYSTRRAGGNKRFPAGSVTAISAPKLQYPSGYSVSVRGGRVVSSANARLLEIASSRGAAEVSVTVTPAVN